MQRRITTLIGLAVVALVVWLVAHNFQPPKRIGHDPAPHASEDGASLHLLALLEGGSARTDDAGLLLMADLLSPERRVDGGTGTTMLDGSPVPLLPMAVPRQVRFGVVLVSYAGAQPSPGSLRLATRSREEARALADRLAIAAGQDFHAAVQQGDPGSADDVGRVKLNVLEPAPEYVLFTLPLSGVAGPVDTPRGYWIVKRLE